MNEEIKNLISIQFWTHSNWKSVQIEPVLSILNADVIYFLNSFSKKITNHEEIRIFPEVASLAFFCRRSNIDQIFKHKINDDKTLQIGRGITFHIAPSNVPLNFAYSLVMGLLAGNVNIVRLPSKNFRQVEIILEILNEMRRDSKYSLVLSKIILIKYSINNIITDYFSSICANRVIWGGDKTIAKIRESNLSPRAFDVTFSDRYSLCIIDTDQLSQTNEIDKLALHFFNDTYLFDQNACTSPHTLVWTGDEQKLEISKQIFWSAVQKIIKSKKYTIQASSVVDKLTYLYAQVIDEKIDSFALLGNEIYLANLNKLDSETLENHINCGYFNEVYIKDLINLSSILNSPRVQTISYFGVDKSIFAQLISENGIKGVDRIVPIGQTSEFSVVWDGYDLVNTLSRKINIY
jgi:hypothetical protein